MKQRGRPRHPDVLTPRQWEVLALLRQGLSNEQIAMRLGISLDGVKFHVSEILGKLGVTSRNEAARWHEERERMVPSASLRHGRRRLSTRIGTSTCRRTGRTGFTAESRRTLRTRAGYAVGGAFRAKTLSNAHARSLAAIGALWRPRARCGSDRSEDLSLRLDVDFSARC